MKAKIIRLPRNEWSCEVAQDCVEQASTFNLKVDFFDGVTGDEADIIFERDNIKKWHGRIKHNTTGVKGCACSHYLLYKECVESNENYLILEHDGYMIRPLPSIPNEGFDVLKLDDKDPYQVDYSQKVKKDYGEIIIDYPDYKGSSYAPFGPYFKGAYAYIITPIGAKKIIDSIHQNGWVPADHQIAKSIVKLQTFKTTIFRIHPNYSHKNIQELSLTRKNFN